MASKKKRKQIRKNSDILHSLEGKTFRLITKIGDCDIIKLIKRSPKGIWSIKLGEGGKIDTKLSQPIGDFYYSDVFFYNGNMSDKELINHSDEFKKIYRERNLDQILK
jgi:hypothetical protein